MLNGEHAVVENLDIYAHVGHGIAHDEYVPFTIKSGQITVGDETSNLSGSKMPIEFLKVNVVFLDYAHNTV